ncbi:MAG: hypothetical protein IT285_06590 [Bdellovibrionales bacterium]|nr:hypothetical protein [Bdellovibrionales bacterium]
MNQNFPFHHLVARAVVGREPFVSRDLCLEAWRRLRLTFPDSAACILMPNHLHLLTEGDPHALTRTLGRTLGALVRRNGVARDVWETVPEPRAIPNAAHLLRQIRYVHLNPCRARLTGDPLAWEWSTHRDWIGAVLNPWPDARRWCGVLKWNPGEAPERLHRYVSADPSVSVSGSRFPVVQGSGSRDFGLAQVAEAVRLAARSPGGGHRARGLPRRWFIDAARELTLHCDAEIARFAGAHRSQLSRAACRPLPPRARRALELVLGDARLGPAPVSTSERTNLLRLVGV